MPVNLIWRTPVSGAGVNGGFGAFLKLNLMVFVFLRGGGDDPAKCSFSSSLMVDASRARFLGVGFEVRVGFSFFTLGFRGAFGFVTGVGAVGSGCGWVSVGFLGSLSFILGIALEGVPGTWEAGFGGPVFNLIFSEGRGSDMLRG